MKSNFNKKLSINKRTVANLNMRELRAAKGGVATYDPGTTCNWDETCPDTCTTCNNCYSINTCESLCTCWPDTDSVCYRCYTDYC